MVGRRKVISSPHRRPISALTTLPPTSRLPRGSRTPGEHHRRCGTRLHEQEGPQVSGSITSKGNETRAFGSDRHAAEHARLLLRRREGGGRQRPVDATAICVSPKRDVWGAADTKDAANYRC